MSKSLSSIVYIQICITAYNKKNSLKAIPTVDNLILYISNTTQFKI